MSDPSAPKPPILKPTQIYDACEYARIGLRDTEVAAILGCPIESLRTPEVSAEMQRARAGEIAALAKIRLDRAMATGNIGEVKASLKLLGEVPIEEQRQQAQEIHADWVAIRLRVNGLFKMAELLHADLIGDSTDPTAWNYVQHASPEHPVVLIPPGGIGQHDERGYTVTVGDKTTIYKRNGRISGAVPDWLAPRK